MQRPTFAGLRAANASELRCVAKPIHNANPKTYEALREMWERATPHDAHRKLSEPDVFVTNMKDKLSQLPKILRLDETIRY